MSQEQTSDGIELIPLATVSVAGIRDGRWDGERLRGNIVGPGGDWAMPGPGGAMLLDVRQVVVTDDGAVVYVTYHGRADRSRGTYTIAPTFETSEERYAWLNLVQAVGKGRLVDGRFVYEVYEVR